MTEETSVLDRNIEEGLISNPAWLEIQEIKQEEQGKRRPLFEYRLRIDPAQLVESSDATVEHLINYDHPEIRVWSEEAVARWPELTQDPNIYFVFLLSGLASEASQWNGTSCSFVGGTYSQWQAGQDTRPGWARFFQPGGKEVKRYSSKRIVVLAMPNPGYDGLILKKEAEGGKIKPDDVGAQEYADTLHEVIQALKIPEKRMVLVPHSAACAAVATYIDQHPTPAKVIMLNAALKLGRQWQFDILGILDSLKPLLIKKEWQDQAQEAIIMGLSGALDVREIKNALREGVQPLWQRVKQLKGLITEIKKRLSPAMTEQVAMHWGQWKKHHGVSVALLKELARPTDFPVSALLLTFPTMIVGERDITTPRQGAEAWQKTLIKELASRLSRRRGVAQELAQNDEALTALAGEAFNPIQLATTHDGVLVDPEMMTRATGEVARQIRRQVDIEEGPMLPLLRALSRWQKEGCVFRLDYAREYQPDMDEVQHLAHQHFTKHEGKGDADYLIMSTEGTTAENLWARLQQIEIFMSWAELQKLLERIEQIPVGQEIPEAIKAQVRTILTRPSLFLDLEGAPNTRELVGGYGEVIYNDRQHPGAQLHKWILDDNCLFSFKYALTNFLFSVEGEVDEELLGAIQKMKSTDLLGFMALLKMPGKEEFDNFRRAVAGHEEATVASFAQKYGKQECQALASYLQKRSGIPEALWERQFDHLHRLPVDFHDLVTLLELSCRLTG